MGVRTTARLQTRCVFPVHIAYLRSDRDRLLRTPHPCGHSVNHRTALAKRPDASTNHGSLAGLLPVRRGSSSATGRLPPGSGIACSRKQQTLHRPAGVYEQEQACPVVSQPRGVTVAGRAGLLPQLTATRASAPPWVTDRLGPGRVFALLGPLPQFTATGAAAWSVGVRAPTAGAPTGKANWRRISASPARGTSRSRTRPRPR